MAATIQPLRFAARSFVVAMALAAAGCSSLSSSGPATQVHSGRFAATISRGNEQETVSGRFTLSASAAHTVLDLASPLGNTLARVEAGANGATLTAPQTDGKLATWHGASSDALAESVLGYALPVTGLPDWILGRAAPDRPARLAPAAGPARRIEQDGWTIVIDERFDQTGMPRRMTLDRAADPASPALRVRLVLDGPGSAIEERGGQ
jgi:outer membrane lipoprotein LolB